MVPSPIRFCCATAGTYQSRLLNIQVLRLASQNSKTTLPTQSVSHVKFGAYRFKKSGSPGTHRKSHQSVLCWDTRFCCPLRPLESCGPTDFLNRGSWLHTGHQSLGSTTAEGRKGRLSPRLGTSSDRWRYRVISPWSHCSGGSGTVISSLSHLLSRFLLASPPPVLTAHFHRVNFPLLSGGSRQRHGTFLSFIVRPAQPKLCRAFLPGAFQAPLHTCLISLYL